MCFCDLQVPFSLLPRARLGLFRAILAKKVFNVFLHPWNLLLYKQLAKDLESFLAFVSSKRDEGKLVAMSLGQLALCLNKGMERDD
jgi:hypothetical protein